MLITVTTMLSVFWYVLVTGPSKKLDSNRNMFNIAQLYFKESSAVGSLSA